MLALDELHDVDAVALEPQQRGPDRVGHRVGEALAQDAVPGQGGVRRGRLLLAQLGGDVVVAAGRGEHQPGLPLDGPGQGLVGRGVAGVQGEDDVGRLGQRGAVDRADHELRAAPEPVAQLARDPFVVLARLLAHVDADQPDRQAAHVAEELQRREAEVAVAAAEVDDPQRVVGGRRAHVARGQRVGERGVEDAQELLDLAVLGLPAGLDLPCVVGDAERDERGVVLGQQPALVAVVVAVGLDLGRAVGGVQQGLALAGHPQLVLLGRGLDVPVAEGLVEQRVDRLARRLADGVVGGEGLRLVVRRDLEVAARLEVDVAQLGPAPARGGGLLPPGRDGAHQRVGVEQVRPEAGQRAEEGLGHQHTS